MAGWQAVINIPTRFCPTLNFVAIAEIQQTWHRDDWEKWANIWARIFTNYGLLLESYAKAVEVTKTGEPMDSLRED